MTIKEKIKSIFTKTIPIIILGYGIYYYIQKEQYAENIKPLTEQVVRIFDKNKDRTMQLEEGLALARAVGCYKSFPTNNLMFELLPGDYRNETIELRVTSNLSKEERGIFGKKRLKPTFREHFYFPLSKLEELAK